MSMTEQQLFYSLMEKLNCKPDEREEYHVNTDVLLSLKDKIARVTTEENANAIHTRLITRNVSGSQSVSACRAGAIMNLLTKEEVFKQIVQKHLSPSPGGRVMETVFTTKRRRTCSEEEANPSAEEECEIAGASPSCNMFCRWATAIPTCNTGPLTGILAGREWRSSTDIAEAPPFPEMLERSAVLFLSVECDGVAKRGGKLTANDGGMDVEMEGKCVAQCKYKQQKVGSKEINELVGSSQSKQGKKFFFAMSYSNNAIEEAAKKNVTLCYGKIVSINGTTSLYTTF